MQLFSPIYPPYDIPLGDTLTVSLDDLTFWEIYGGEGVGGLIAERVPAGDPVLLHAGREIAMYPSNSRLS